MNSHLLRRNLIALCIVFLLLATISTPFFGAAQQFDKKQESNTAFFKISENNQKIKPIMVSSTNFLKETSFNQNNTQDIPVAVNSTYSEKSPSVIADGNNVFVAYEFSNETNSYVYIKKSSDYGQNWSSETFYFPVDVNATSPSFVKTPTDTSYAFGAFLTPDNSSYIYESKIRDLGNSYSWDAEPWDYSSITDSSENRIGGFMDFKNICTISYNDYNIPWIIGTIGDSDFVEGYEDYICEDSPIFIYQDPAAQATKRSIIFFPEVKDSKNISICLGRNESAAPMVYGVCEIKNDSNTDLLFFHGNPEIWDEEDLLRKQNISVPYDLLNPKISVYQNNIYISAETTSDEMVMCYSSNYGTDWTISEIVNESTDDTYAKNPQLFVNSTQISCAFTNYSNLEIMTSYDNGENWTEPFQINDINNTVDTSRNSFDMKNPHQIIWTDNRNSNNDLYYHLDHIPTVDLEVVNFTITKQELQLFLPTNNLLDVEIKNNGDTTSGSVSLNISYMCNGTNSTVIENTCFITSLAPGETDTVRCYLFNFEIPEALYALVDFSGIQNMTVRVEIDDTNSNNNVLTKTVSFEQIFPKLSILEDIFMMLKGIV